MTFSSVRPFSAVARISLVSLFGASLLVVSGVGCGARSEMFSFQTTDASTPDADAGPKPQCSVVSDCPGAENLCLPVACTDGVCVKNAPSACASQDLCMDAQCIPSTGKCVLTPSSFDLDKDGHPGPKPGFAPGAPGSCGDDCDDTNPNAFPGNKEVCDGVDNDCNGVVDDNARYVPNKGDIRVSDAALTRAYPGGLASDGTNYLAAYSGQTGARTRSFGLILDQNGNPIGSQVRLAQVESDAFPADAVWIGDRYAVTWVDRRTGDYEVFMAMFDATGVKLAPGDIRVSNSPEFSIAPSMVWTGAEFILAWQDGAGDNGSFKIFGRRIGLDGIPRSGITQLTDDSAQTPLLAVGQPGLGLVWMRGDAVRQSILFQPFDFNLMPTLPQPVDLTRAELGEAPALVWNKSAFAVAWTRPGTMFSLWGAIINGDGTVATPAKQISDSPRFARDASLVSLGDRILMVNADNRDQNTGYELYTRMLTPALDAYPNSVSTRITTNAGDSVSPIARFGPKGDVGVLFRDDRTGPAQTYFTHLVCEAGNP